jgi:hypothetical protein
LHHGCHHPVDFGLGADVTNLDLRFAAVLANTLRDFLQFIRIPPDQAEAGAVFGQCFSNTAAIPAAGSGNNYDTVLKFHDSYLQ